MVLFEWSLKGCVELSREEGSAKLWKNEGRYEKRRAGLVHLDAGGLGLGCWASWALSSRQDEL